MDPDELAMQLPSDAAVLTGVRRQVRDWAGRHGWSERQVGDVVLAIDEALINVIRHGYGGKPGKTIEFSLRRAEHPGKGEGLEVRIRDFSTNVNLKEICGRDLDEVRPGGLGVHLIRAMMESVEYTHAEGGGVLLVMRKSKRHVAQANEQEGNG